MIPISRPNISAKDAQELRDTILSGWIVEGKKVKDFEDNLSKKLKQKVVTTNSGTSALMLCLLALKEENAEKNEVIILMATERNLSVFPFGFIDNVYDLYATPDTTDAAIQMEAETFYKFRKERKQWWEKNLWMTDRLLKIEIEKAANNRITLFEMIRNEAAWLFDNECEISPKKKRLIELETDLRKNYPYMKSALERSHNTKTNIDKLILKDVFDRYYKEVKDSLSSNNK